MNTGPTLRQPDWWNCEDEITSITRNITGKLGKLFYKVGWVFLMVVISMLPHAEFEPNDHWKDAPHLLTFIMVLIIFLEALPESSQEVLIVDDLMSLILGGKAAYFTAHVDQTEKHVMLHFCK